MSRPATTVAALLLAVGSGAASAQRADASPVLEPPRRAPAAAPHDLVPDFGAAYRQAGAPKVMLLWNRALSDESQAAALDRKVTREVGVKSDNRVSKSTAGDAGTMSTTDEESKFDKTKTETTSKIVAGTAARRNGLEERHALQLERAFVAEMNRAGLRFVDRTLAMRETAATKHRGGGDPQLIETDAIRAYADLLMEVLWIEDRDAPAGYAFDVRAKDLKTGQQIASVYSRGVPPRRPAGEGGWVAGKDGYEFARPAAAPGPSPAEVGAALSHDVMRTLGAVFVPAVAEAKRR